jgi:outer membrane protein OmpA-like peptidoglycan-associated protein
VKDPGLQIGVHLGGLVGDNEKPKEYDNLQDFARFTYRAFLDFGLIDRLRVQFSGAFANMAGKYYSTEIRPIEGRLMYFPIYSEYFSPYLYAGAGLLPYNITKIAPGRLSPGLSKDGWVVNAPAGVGFVTEISHRTALDLNMGWNYISSDKTNGRVGGDYDSYWTAFIGFRFALGKTAYDRYQEEIQKQLVEQERLRKEAELRAAEQKRKETEAENALLESRLKELEAQKALEEKRAKDLEAQKALEEQKALEAQKAAEEQKLKERLAVKVEQPPPPKPGIKFEAIYFNSGSAWLALSETAKLDEAAKILKQSPDIKLELSGHADSQGSYAVNEKISVARVNAVRNYLMSKGIQGERLWIAGFASDKPAGDNTTPEGRRLNRRVEMEVVR